MKQNDPQPLPFEKAFSRLEEILNAMNSGKSSLDEALALYEEADQLICHCSRRLSEAEQRVEVLIKSREGALTQDASGAPKTAPFSPSTEQSMGG